MRRKSNNFVQIVHHLRTIIEVLSGIMPQHWSKIRRTKARSTATQHRGIDPEAFGTEGYDHGRSAEQNIIEREIEERAGASADAPCRQRILGHQAKWPLSDGRRFGPRRFCRPATPQAAPVDQVHNSRSAPAIDTRDVSSRGAAMKSAEAPPRPPPPSRSPLAACAANGDARCCSGQRMTVSVAYHRQICVPNARDTWCNLYQYQDQDHSISMSSDAL